YKVYLSARVNAAVFYDLSLLNLLLPSRKNLEIGLGLVNVLTLGELRAVLAHEFGHFAQRSMAVGRWVYVAHQITAQPVARRDRALNFAQGETRRGAPPRDLFALQQQVMARMAAILDDPLHGRVPALPLAGAAAHRIFKAELTQPPRMWLTHPLNHEREANAKK